MVEIIEVDTFHASRDTVGKVKFKTMEELKRVAEALNVPYIFKRKDEKDYCFFHETICYYC